MNVEGKNPPSKERYVKRIVELSFEGEKKLSSSSLNPPFSIQKGIKIDCSNSNIIKVKMTPSKARFG